MRSQVLMKSSKSCVLTLMTKSSGSAPNIWTSRVSRRGESWRERIAVPRHCCRESNLILQHLNTRLWSVFISEMHYQVRAPSESEAATWLKDRQCLPNEQLKHSLSIKKLIGWRQMLTGTIFCLSENAVRARSKMDKVNGRHRVLKALRRIFGRNRPLF